MSDKQNIPLGLALKNAGLISQEQLQKALELQSKYTQMKLGEILRSLSLICGPGLVTVLQEKSEFGLVSISSVWDLYTR